MSQEQPHNYERIQLRVQLVNALAGAEKCDDVVAIYVETALAMVNERLDMDN